MIDEADLGKGMVASRLRRLFELHRREDGTEYSPQYVADAVAKAAGAPVLSSTYVWQLKAGHRDNPTYKHLAALAWFFGVSPSYFFGLDHDDQSAASDIALLNDRVRDIALRTVGLSERSIQVISDLVDGVRALDPPQEPRKKSNRSKLDSIIVNDRGVLLLLP